MVSAIASELINKDRYYSAVNGRLDFKRPGHDALILNGTVPLANDFLPAGQTLAVDFGGVSAMFVLDAKGNALTSQGRVGVKVKPGQPARFTIKLNGAFAASWSDEGVDPNSSAKNQPVSFAVTLTVGAAAFMKQIPVTYSARAGASGAFRFAK
ncbi:MAG: hypothetical protein WCT04_20185 [Planctomycetota bacterium]